MKNDLIPVDGERGLFRDPNTNAIINRNLKDYESYMRRKKSQSESNQKIQKIEDDLSSLKSDIDEIKILLKSYLK